MNAFKLDYDVLKVSRGVAYGSTTLKSLQNDNLPELDLLVREAIQNSSDAAIGQPGNSFTVSFTTDVFTPYQFNSYMTGVESYLNNKYPHNCAEFLEIRDTGTCGLTGDVRDDEENISSHGNFVKCVFDTGIRQTAEGAGGNWGFGKSVYYRVGSGIVVFYSRIKIDGRYESRLIFTVIEDEQKENGILSVVESKPAGKGWWGIKSGNSILPVTDENIINDFLKVFNLKPFNSAETGTSIIIPYIDKKKLLSDIIPEESEMPSDVRDVFKSSFANDIDSYLTLAVQKWYGPKLFNKHLEKFEKKWLRAVINNVVLNEDDMLPIFKTVQQLYNICWDYYKSEIKPDKNEIFDCTPIRILKYLEGNSVSGCLATAVIERSSVVTEESPFSPFTLAGKFSADDNSSPLFMFARDPGMIINYEIEGGWVGNANSIDLTDKYLIAFYLPNFNKKLKDELSVKEYSGIPLTEYLRMCEASDHCEWNDKAKMQLITAIKRNVVKALKHRMPEKDSLPNVSNDNRIKAKLGHDLMPIKKKQPKGQNGGGGGEHTSESIGSLKYSPLKYSSDGIEINYELKLKNGCKSVILQLFVKTEAESITYEQWKNDVGTIFPYEFVSASIFERSEENGKKAILSPGIKCSRDSGCVRDNFSAIKLTRENNDEFKLNIKSEVFDSTIKGVISINTFDKKFEFGLKLVGEV